MLTLYRICVLSLVFSSIQFNNCEEHEKDHLKYWNGTNSDVYLENSRPPVSIPDPEDLINLRPPGLIPDPEDSINSRPSGSLPNLEILINSRPPGLLPDQEDIIYSGLSGSLIDPEDIINSRPSSSLPDPEDLINIKPPGLFPFPEDLIYSGPSGSLIDPEDLINIKPPGLFPFPEEIIKSRPSGSLPNPENLIDLKPPGLSNDECVYNIYRRCNYPTQFSAQELENVRLYLNYSFMELADVKPDKPLCSKIYVRQDWKCLTDVQIQRLVYVLRRLYAQGVMLYLSDFHQEWWPAWHKTREFFGSHRWLGRQLEKKMQAIDPSVTLPYWMPWLYASQPERSSIWDTLGHAGNYSNGYRVPDGIYPTFNLVPAIRRHWACSGKIYPWVPIEFVSSIIQTSSTVSEFATNFLGFHFGPHLNCGGYEGQLAVKNAPFDFLFYLYHVADVDVMETAWQFLRKENLTPLSYNLGQVKFNQTNGNVETPNIFTDTLNGVPYVTMRELFWLGFGDLCYIPDRFVKPMNKLWIALQTNTTPQPDHMPTAAKRLPPTILKQYFPVFLNRNYSIFSHLFEEVGECNTQCYPISKPTFMPDTEQGRRQIRAYEYDNGLDLGFSLKSSEQNYYRMWLNFNAAGYCSPFVTTY